MEVDSRFKEDGAAASVSFSSAVEAEEDDPFDFDASFSVAVDEDDLGGLGAKADLISGRRGFEEVEAGRSPLPLLLPPPKNLFSFGCSVIVADLAESRSMFGRMFRCCAVSWLGCPKEADAVVAERVG